MNFIEEQVIQNLKEKGIEKPKYPDKMNYVEYKYPVKDEITGEILEYKKISGKELKKLSITRRKKLIKIGEEIFDEENYKNASKDYEKNIKEYKEEFNKVLE